jgi:hypothetical protein
VLATCKDTEEGFTGNLYGSLSHLGMILAFCILDVGNTLQNRLYEAKVAFGVNIGLESEFTVVL